MTVSEFLKNNVIYMTTSWGGMEGKDLEKKYFVSEQAAKRDALDDGWNSRYQLHKIEIKITEQGQICFNDIFLGNISCGRDQIK